MSRPRCAYPVGDFQGEDLRCDRPAAWETDDLQEVHHLCDEHCREALRWNDFRREAVQP